MKVVLKYKLGNFHGVTIKYIDRFAEICHVGIKDEVPYVWIAVDEEAKLKQIEIRTVYTGWPFDSEGWEFIGSTIMDEELVFHYYARVIEVQEKAAVLTMAKPQLVVA